MITRLLAAIAVWSALAPCAVAEDASCPFPNATFANQRDTSFSLAFTPPPADNGVAISSFVLRQADTEFLRGFLTVSQGFGSLWLIPDGDAYSDSQIQVSFLDANLVDSSDEASYAVVQALPSTLYYMDRELWSRHPLAGSVWKLSGCNR